MELQNKPLDEPKSGADMQEDSLQYNAQHLDQEQRCAMNPSQANTQSVHVYINNQADFSARITGTVFLARSGEPVPGASIFLFLGNERQMPVCQTESDQNGGYEMGELPPGYYTLRASRGEALRYRSYLLKALPGQTVSHAVYLR